MAVITGYGMPSGLVSGLQAVRQKPGQSTKAETNRETQAKWEEASRGIGTARREAGPGEAGQGQTAQTAEVLGPQDQGRSHPGPEAFEKHPGRGGGRETQRGTPTPDAQRDRTATQQAKRQSATQKATPEERKKGADPQGKETERRPPSAQH